MIRSKADKIRQYAQELIENGTLDLARISNSLIRQMAQDLTRAYGEEFKPNTVKQTLYKLRSQQPRHEEPEEEPPPTTTTKHETPPPRPQNPITQFQITKRSDNTAIIQCPNCGAIDLDAQLPVIEKPVEVTKEVEYIPPHYFKVTCGHLNEILSLKHEDGKTISECPEDAKTLLEWYNQHKEELEQAAGIKKKDPNTLGKLIELGLAGLAAYEAYKRYTQNPTTTTTWTQPQPNYYMQTQTQSILQQLKEQGLLP